ncbi:type II toxin-antitoxin system RelE/ParE family toxin [Polaromonas naphthalenivorans]|uniref:Type II toxin-antitoxin system RelE/ParE family toxin n=1 Tax=Polaromonas naphthalenivorans (strain CJ2) TaxID=365044 RepID=A1VVB2_POLNA|nr:type II toxin-antitoxin system RelE/ParE family toxin [Polaromonas naphthalenivorans]ABM39590.1 protein of unknown function DUF1044 [Polaromonas naphthalenivorans CJ2]
MHSKKVFKTKSFARWARKLISDSELCVAALEIEKNLYEADLGGGVCKKRIAVPGHGKSGSTRTLVAKRHENAIFFIVGRSKSDPGADFSPTEETVAKAYAGLLQKASLSKLNQMKVNGALVEICDDKENCKR